VSRLPRIDLDASDEAVADELLTAYREVGFASISSHGVDRSLLNDVFDASRRFHELPEAEKGALALNEFHRGYIPLGASTEVASEYEHEVTPNASESFMMLGDATAGFLAGPNQWPTLEGFRDVIEAYHDELLKLSRRLIGCFALALGDDVGEMEALFEVPTTWLRLLRYPTQRASGFGLGPHRDYGAITLLAQRDVSGLDVLGPDGTWIEVDADPDVLVLNTGEVMHRWSNGQLLRTPHRVINRSGRERYSIPFFFDPHMHSMIEPLASCLSGSRPAVFEPFDFESFLRSELTAGYDAHRSES
jgi:isopenicillin N synthase-like dioxygenase